MSEEMVFVEVGICGRVCVWEEKCDVFGFQCAVVRLAGERGKGVEGVFVIVEC